MLMEQMVNQLEDKLMSEVHDATKIGLVRTGKLQDNPLIAEFNVLVRQGDDSWRHKRAPKDHHSVHKVGVFGMGPTVSEFWLRRFLVEAKFFFVGETDRETAIEEANMILSRLEDALLTVEMPQETDSFGETALQIDLEDSYLSEGGGPGTFIHRGVVRVEFLTERIRS